MIHTEYKSILIKTVLAMLPLMLYMCWYSAQVGKITDSCKPNFELQICEFDK